MLDGLELYGMGASWGGFESLALPSEVAKLRTATPWVNRGPVIRIHAGLEDPSDLIADLDAGFARLRQAQLHIGLRDVGSQAHPRGMPVGGGGVPAHDVLGRRVGLPDAPDGRAMYEATRQAGFGAEVKRRIMIGTYALSAGYHDAYYVQAQRVRTLIRRDFDAAFAGVDAILLPTAPTTAFELGARLDDPLAMYANDVFTLPVNLAGIPALSLPNGLVDGLPVAQYIDARGQQTSSADGFTNLPEWSPIYLHKGELTFDTAGSLVSPKSGAQLDPVFLPDGKGELTINIDYSKSTQFSSPFAVLSQSQDGAPEGDLVGVNIGDDGLVNASYSNGSQQSLGKIVLVNFSNPNGLRQIGDSSYYSSSSSGTPKFGEAGGAGFGTIRAGARERANVDLTQELVDLITAQRNFQANAKAIETSTALTQSIIQIRN